MRKSHCQSVFRTHTVIVYLPGHPVREKAIRDAGQYWKERDVNATQWDFVIASDCEDAIRRVRVHYSQPGIEVKRIFSLNHIGDITIGGSVESTALSNIPTANKNDSHPEGQ